MLRHKDYLFITEICEKLKLSDHCTDEKAVRYIFCKALEKYTEFKNPEMVKEISFLKAKNLKGRIQNGEIAVNKKRLIDHLDEITSVQDEITRLMLDRENHTTPAKKEAFGKAMAKQWSRLQFTKHAMQHFELKVHLKKLK